jgi:hypothetical protein
MTKKVYEILLCDKDRSLTVYVYERSTTDARKAALLRYPRMRFLKAKILSPLIIKEV